MVQQQAKAAAFRVLHSGKEILLLPNVWDVASARVIEEAGFKAVATSSAGIAFSLGYPDGQIIPRKEMLAVIARIVKAVHVPVTADVEAGYGKSPEDAGQTARAVIDAGAVGMNLEDAIADSTAALVELPLQVEKIHAIREMANRLRVPLVLNARTDVYLLQIGDPAKRYDETVRRLSAFRDAGADCVFVPGLRDAATIGRIMADLKCPVNILGGPGSPYGAGAVQAWSSPGQFRFGSNARWPGSLAPHCRRSKNQGHIFQPGRCSHVRRDESHDGANFALTRQKPILIGVISDTHGLLRLEAIEALRGSDHIIHAGDIGAPDILDQLSAIAPVTAVRGNVDKGAWAQKLPETEVVEAGGVSIYVLHDLAQLDLKPKAAGFSAVISGHTHVPKQEMRDGVLYFNPGSAGPRRFKLPVGIGKLFVEDGRVQGELLQLAVTHS